MALVILIDLIILLELGTSIYNYSDIKVSLNDDNNNGDKSKKLALTNIIIVSIVLSLINILYFMSTINPKRTVLNLILLSIISSVLIIISYNYLRIQSQNMPGYQASKDALIANTENINKNIREFNLIVASNTISISGLILAFYIGYKFFSRVEIRNLEKPFFVLKKYKKYKKPKLNFKLKNEDFESS